MKISLQLLYIWFPICNKPELVGLVCDLRDLSVTCRRLGRLSVFILDWKFRALEFTNTVSGKSWMLDAASQNDGGHADSSAVREESTYGSWT